MFTAFKVISVTELVLGANENIDNVQRLKWNVARGGCGLLARQCSGTHVRVSLFVMSAGTAGKVQALPGKY